MQLKVEERNTTQFVAPIDASPRTEVMEVEPRSRFLALLGISKYPDRGIGEKHPKVNNMNA